MYSVYTCTHNFTEVRTCICVPVKHTGREKDKDVMVSVSILCKCTHVPKKDCLCTVYTEHAFMRSNSYLISAVILRVGTDILFTLACIHDFKQEMLATAIKDGLLEVKCQSLRTLEPVKYKKNVHVFECRKSTYSTMTKCVLCSFRE